MEGDPVLAERDGNGDRGKAEKRTEALGIAAEPSNLDTDVLIRLLERSMGASKMATSALSSDEERAAAAIVVQAGYKGHLVRKTQPLAQLREIGGIELELKKLKEHAEDAAFVEELRKGRSTVKVGFEEAAVALLLKLDNMPDSHSSVRQIRKSVEREVVTLHLIVDAPLLQLRATAGIEGELKKLQEQFREATFARLQEQFREATFAEGLRTEDFRDGSAATLGIEYASVALLAQLSAIRDSHPVVRQVRKSLAREIGLLQESVHASRARGVSSTLAEKATANSENFDR